LGEGGGEKKKKKGFEELQTYKLGWYAVARNGPKTRKRRKKVLTGAHSHTGKRETVEKVPPNTDNAIWRWNPRKPGGFHSGRVEKQKQVMASTRVEYEKQIVKGPGNR